MEDKEIKALNKRASDYSNDIDEVVSQIKNVVVGQSDVVDRIMISLIANGHILLEGLPGLAKTLMIKTLSDTVDASFNRIQFTPDILPADIVGTKIYNQNNATFSTKKGPIFANFILADEINRAPPKAQSALLEAMQERQVTISGETYPLSKPFLVLATQNPLETQGTYTLPEAQVDRFMFKVNVNYPLEDEEKQIISRMTGSTVPFAKKVITPAKIIEMQKLCHEIYLDDNVRDFIVSIVFATRDPKKYGLDIDNLIEYGASPRASIWLTLGAKAHALLQGRGYVIPDDVKEIAVDVLRHRIILTYEAEAEGVSTDKLVEMILSKVKSP
ncbi:MAG: AAA domain-containing protein [Nanohaloarchaea archaeon]|nr:AAA domain-containing protein [Candidatus Nanohaloarchaea archaeon]